MFHTSPIVQNCTKDDIVVFKLCFETFTLMTVKQSELKQKGKRNEKLAKHLKEATSRELGVARKRAR